MAKISVIIPINNEATYVDAICMSLFCQVEQNIQIIFVSNASDADTADILKRYADFDERIGVLFVHRQTSLLDCCRLALEYVKYPSVVLLNGTKNFFMAQTYFRRMSDSMKKNKSDFVYAPSLILGAQTFIKLPFYQVPDQVFKKFIKNPFFSMKDMNERLFFELSLSPWGKLYNTDFLRGRSFDTFEESFGLECFFAAKRISYIFNNLCFYKAEPRDFENQAVFDEQMQNQKILEKYGVYDKYKDFFVCHKMQKIWYTLGLTAPERQAPLFERMKADFAGEDFGKYNPEILARCVFYHKLHQASKMDLQQFRRFFR